MVELLQLSGGGGEHTVTGSSPCPRPRAPAMRTEKEPEEGRDLDRQSAEDRTSEGGESAPHRLAAHIGPAKFKPAEGRRGRALPAGPARAGPAYPVGHRPRAAMATREGREGFVRACRGLLRPGLPLSARPPRSQQRRRLPPETVTKRLRSPASSAPG